MTKEHVWGAHRSSVSSPAEWPPNARNSQTWLHPDGSESQLLAYSVHVKREGLAPFGGYATPSQQRKGQKARNAVWKLPTWAVGLRLVVGACSPPDAVGWWWSSAKGLAEKLRGMPPGRERVQTVAACCVAIEMAWSVSAIQDPIQAAWPVVRAARWPR